ncbi:arogenate dehydrogenase chloroplastic-like [Raphidocelis subcapitata]|uniref:Arogenate dehydrogenase chloroplastic-like n=1 Tax=Raphidocelis subcapitata TaxID=307507 RepID=A0A2V0PPG8_9CHLO|nr:arogenate dehydrogenase chloroplastic-like [Raphidocelis subcapitata]|eukprot:GBG00064.1 arogenate dehydrogenase chloroplastic-like [Raphidocelis subcapitata]
MRCGTVAAAGKPAAAAPPRRARGAVRVLALDAAQPFDFEHRARQKLARDQQLTIGIVGFGTFGQFLARRMARAGHRVLATSRSPYHDQARAMGVAYFQDVDDFCEEHPDVVILASSILSTADVLRALPVQRLKRNTLFVDVLSVKGLNFMYEVVRVGPDTQRMARIENLLKFFRAEGCRMVEMSCEEHDRQAASTQFITHTVGRVLGAMDVQSTDINTRGFDALLNLVENTSHDSFDLYYGLFLYNANATEELQRLEQAFDTVKKQLLGRMHDIVRQQLQLPSADSGDASSSGGVLAQQQPQQQQQKQPRLLGSGPRALELPDVDASSNSSSSSSRSGEAVQVEVLAPEQQRS